MSEIQQLLKPLVGFRKVSNDVGYVWAPGEAIAFRKDGDELLFAATPELPETVIPGDVPKEPLAWIPVGDFAANPLCLHYAEDFVEDDDEELPTIPVAQAPVGPRRRGK